MLLEECIFSVHMSTVKKSVPVYDFIPIIPAIVRIIILFILDVVLMRCNILPWCPSLHRKSLTRLAWLLETKSSIIPI